MQAFRRQPQHLSPLAAMRAAVGEGFSEITAEETADAVERMRLVMAVPELRAGVAGELVETIDRLSGLCAERMRLPASDMKVRALAGAVVGAMLAAFLMDPDLGPGFVERIDEALVALESSFS